MNVSSGTTEYTLGSFPVTGYGFSYTVDELDSALAGPVAEVVYDNSGKADIDALLSGLAETNFEKAAILRPSGAGHG